MDDILLHYRQLGLIFDTFSMGVMVIGADRKIISLNHSAEIITGHNESDLRGKCCSQVLLEPLCGGECQYLDAVESSRSAGSVDFDVSDRNQAKHSITRIVSPIYGPDRVPLGCIEVFQDHTVFKDLLERVRHDDRRLKIILDNLDIGVLTVDRGGHITFFNNQAETITGFNRGNVLGKSCSMLFGKTTSHHMLLFEETIADGRARSTSEGEIKTHDGQAIPIRANYMALKNEDGRIVGGLATISDLSLKYQFNSEIRGRYTFYDMVGKDPAMQKIFEIVPVVAATDATVLIEGPTGTGKDILAKVIHNAGKRSKKPLVKVNCAALPDNLLESEMFGYAKGAFTGAIKAFRGVFEEADGGTVFLDEIGEISPFIQVKLLRVLQEREIERVGDSKTRKVNIRIIAATNRNLEELVKKSHFREDLWFRLNVFPIEMPPLSDTSILASTGAASDHIDHVKTQLPYALVVGIIGIVIGNIGDASAGCGPTWEALCFATMDQFKELWEESHRGGLPFIMNFVNNFYGMGGQPVGETMGFGVLARVGLGVNPDAMHAERVDGD